MKRKINLSPTIIMVILLFAMRIARGGFSNFADFIMDRLLMLPAIVVGLSLHEFGHAYASDKLGDPTPRQQGRVTINPISHVDPIGFLALIFAGFGWGVPVSIDPRYYKNRRRDEAIVAVAGVTMNLIIVVIATMVTFIFVRTAGSFLGTSLGEIVFEILLYFITINSMLMVFNLLPVPPLDGFNLVTKIFKLDKYEWWYLLYRSGPMILLFLVLFNVVGIIISPITKIITGICFSIIQ